MNRVMTDGASMAWRLFLATVLAGATWVTCGCVHRETRLRSAREAFLYGDLDAADQQLDRLVGKRKARNEVLLADKAMLRLLQGKVEEAEELLRQVRDGFDHLEQQDAAELTLSMLTDDRRRAYAGEAYERVLVCNFLAISNLLGAGDDAIAYCLQANQKQNDIIAAAAGDETGNPNPPPNRVALAAYLHGVLQEASHTNYDDARRAYASVAKWKPSFHSVRDDLHRVQTSSHSAPGNGVIYLIALVGPGPMKEEVVAPVTSQALAIATQLLHAIGDHDVPLFSAPVKIPAVVLARSQVDGVLVSSVGNHFGVTEIVTDIGQLAIDQCAAARDQTIARAVVRRVVKKAAVYKAKDELASNPWSALAWDVTSLFWEATESADTRCWSMLPGTVQLLRCELPAGTHKISLAPVAKGQIAGPPHTKQVNVADGRNTYVLACFPDRRLSGTIVTSR